MRTAREEAARIGGRKSPQVTDGVDDRQIEYAHKNLQVDGGVVRELIQNSFQSGLVEDSQHDFGLVGQPQHQQRVEAGQVFPLHFQGLLVLCKTPACTPIRFWSFPFLRNALCVTKTRDTHPAILRGARGHSLAITDTFLVAMQMLVMHSAKLPYTGQSLSTFHMQGSTGVATMSAMFVTCCIPTPHETAL